MKKKNLLILVTILVTCFAACACVSYPATNYAVKYDAEAPYDKKEKEIIDMCSKKEVQALAIELHRKLKKSEKRIVALKRLLRENGYEIHEVKRGDTLYNISIKHYGHSCYSGLLGKINYIGNDNKIMVGQILLIPNRRLINLFDDILHNK
jgi:LysM repeat protein